jgi:serine/threonine protein kinase
MLVDYGLEDASPECEDVVMAMLKVNPEERPTARQLLMHPWFDDVREASCKAPIQRGIPVVKLEIECCVRTWPKTIRKIHFTKSLVN